MENTTAVSSEKRRTAVQPFIARYSTDVSSKAVERLFNESTLVLDHIDEIDYDPSVIWAGDLGRSLARKTHGWFFLRYWYSAWDVLSQNAKDRLIQDFQSLYEYWKTKCQISDMVYHDETTAQRAINFAVFLDAAGADLPESAHNELVEFVDGEFSLLSSDDFYGGSNNHGMFQDTSVLVGLAYGYSGGDPVEVEAKSLERLNQYFGESFGTDGVHRENNPTYHLMVSRHLAHVLNYCKLVGAGRNLNRLQALFKLADHYAAFTLTPRNHFVPISDTNKGPVARANVESTFGEGEMLGALLHGSRGSVPQGRIFTSEESGYAVYRSDWGEKANYLFFSSAYNADYHKHSDEMSLYYYANGREIIAESGPNGYEYTDPLTKYAFSSAAHNSMLVDGEGLPRVDGKSEQTTMQVLSAGTESLKVEGKTTRFSGVTWRRAVEVPETEEGATVLLSDRVISEQEHAFTFLWHMGEDLVPIVRGNAIEIFDADQKVAELTWTGDAPIGVRSVRGQRHPYHQGWIFPKMGKAKANYAIEVEFRGEDLSVDWELRSRDFKIVDRGIAPGSEWSAHEAEKPVNYLLENADRVGNGLAVVFTAMAQPYDFTFNYRASMSDFKGAVLYVLDDYGDQGAYYIASNRNLAEFRSVQSLIRTAVDELGLTMSNVIMIGSSKGGTAALLHGVSAGVSRVVVGGPQYRIGDFVRGAHPNVLEYVAGGKEQNDVNWLNDIARRILSSGVRSTRVSVVVGKRDGHYRHHSVPLVDDLRMLGYTRVEHLTVPGTPHSELGGVFRHFLESLCREKQDEQFLLANTAAYDKNTKIFGVAVSAAPGNTVLAQLFRGKERIGSLVSVKNGVAEWQEVTEPGLYRARIYVDSNDGAPRQAFASTAVRV